MAGDKTEPPGVMKDKLDHTHTHTHTFNGTEKYSFQMNLKLRRLLKGQKQQIVHYMHQTPKQHRAMLRNVVLLSEIYILLFRGPGWSKKDNTC